MSAEENIYISFSERDVKCMTTVNREIAEQKKRENGWEKSQSGEKITINNTIWRAKRTHFKPISRNAFSAASILSYFLWVFFFLIRPFSPLFHFEKMKYHFVWAQHTNGKFGDKTLFSAVWFVLNIQHKNRIVTVRVIEPRYCLCAALSASSYVQFRSILFVIRKEKRMKSLDTGSLMFYRILCVEFVPHFYWLFHFEKALFVINVYILASSSFRQPFSMTTIVGFYLQI